MIKLENSESEIFIIKPIWETFFNILMNIESILQEQLNDQSIMNFGYKSQIERFLFTIYDLKNKVSAIKCINICNDIINISSHLFHVLVQTLLLLLSTSEILLALKSQMNNYCYSNSIVFELFMGTLINKIAELQGLLRDWHIVVINFLSYSSRSTSTYVASYVPKQQVMPTQPPVQTQNACVPCPPNVNKPFVHNINNCNQNNY